MGINKESSTGEDHGFNQELGLVCSDYSNKNKQRTSCLII